MGVYVAFRRACRIWASLVECAVPRDRGALALAWMSEAIRPRGWPRSPPPWTVRYLTFGRDLNPQQINGLYHWGKTAFTTHMSGLGRLPLVGLPAEERRPSWLERAIYGFDGALRRWQSVVEFTGDPSCILRIRVGRLDRDVTLADGTSGRAGERFVDLHLWNEQVPAMPREEASIAWARQMHACFRQSLAQLARYLAERGDLNDISVVRCTLMFAGPERDGQMARLLARYGFELVPAADPRGLREHARRFGENILISLIVLARNAASLRRDTLRRGRTRVFMSRRLLEQRYATVAVKSSVDVYSSALRAGTGVPEPA